MVACCGHLFHSFQHTSHRGSDHHAPSHCPRRQPFNTAPVCSRDHRRGRGLHCVCHLRPGGAEQRAGITRHHAVPAERRTPSADHRSPARDRRSTDGGVADRRSPQTRLHISWGNDLRGHASRNIATTRWRRQCPLAQLLASNANSFTPASKPDEWNASHAAAGAGDPDALSALSFFPSPTS
jgi:hypothetical protein